MKIRHILSNGREVDSVKGMIIPFNERTAGIYRYVANRIREEMKNDSYGENQHKTASGAAV